MSRQQISASRDGRHDWEVNIDRGVALHSLTKPRQGQIFEKRWTGGYGQEQIRSGKSGGLSAFYRSLTRLCLAVSGNQSVKPRCLWLIGTRRERIFFRARVTLPQRCKPQSKIPKRVWRTGGSRTFAQVESMNGPWRRLDRRCFQTLRPVICENQSTTVNRWKQNARRWSVIVRSPGRGGFRSLA